MKKELETSIPKISKQLNLKTISNPFNQDNVSRSTESILEKFEDKDFLIAAGRLAPVKGFDLLIDAFKNLCKQNENLHLIILGEGSERAFLQEKINILGLTNKVFLPGYVNNVYPYFKNAIGCVLSSRLEGFPNVLLQMMSQNTTVVATLSAGDIENIPGLITCPPNDTMALTNQIEKALKSNTAGNRRLFDSFLSTRTQLAFHQNVLNALN
ncbi:MAG: glycosyltransferase [Maribacter sp.]